MADGLVLKLGVELDTSNVQAQLDSILNSKNGKINISVNTKQAEQQISVLKKSISSSTPAKILVDVLKGQSESNISNFINNIQNKYTSNPIKLVFDVDLGATKTNIESAMQNIQQQAQKAAQEAAKAAGQVGDVLKETKWFDTKAGDIQIQGTTKYFDELMEAAKRMGDAFQDVDAKVSKISIRDSLDGAQTAVVTFSNAIGELTSATFKLEDGEWNKFSESFTKSFKDGTKDIDKALKDLQSFQMKLDTIQSKGFERTNQLSGSFAEPVTQGIENTQQKINSLVDNITRYKDTLQDLQEGWITQQKFEERTGNLFGEGGFNSAVEQVQSLKKELADLDLLRIKQQNTQYQAKQLSSTDITSQIPIITNEITALENKLNSLGFGEKFQGDIAILRQMLSSLGQEGGTTIQQFNSQMRDLKSQIDTFKTTTQGKSLISAESLGKNQIEEVQRAIQQFENYAFEKGYANMPEGESNPFAYGMTEGIENSIAGLQSLKEKYQELYDYLQRVGNGTAPADEKSLRETERLQSELDQQLKAYQQISSNLGTDKKSQDWIAAQNTGITEMKTKFEQYREEISKTIELTPELQSRMDALAETMGRSGAVDIANWKDVNSEFKDLQATIEAFRNTTQGKASELAIGIDTSQIKEIDTTLQNLSNVGDKVTAGAGLQSLIGDLNNLKTEYQDVMTQLQQPNLTQDQFESLSQRAKELDDTLKNLTKEAGTFGNDNSIDVYNGKVETLKLTFEKLEQQYANLIRSNPEIAAKFGQLKEDIENIRPGGLQSTSKELSNLGKECANATGQVGGLRGALTEAFGGVGSYLARFTSAYFIISKVISGIKSMVNEVKAVDSSLVELQKVTDLTGNSLDQFTEKAYRVGEGLGRTGQDVIDATTTFSRAGYDLKEATDLAQSALVMTNVGADIKSTESAASDMISILKAFNIQAEDSMSVIDKLYNVSNKEPLDFGNLTQMLVTAGGTLAQTGTTLEETMALLTGGFATLRDTSVSNGLKYSPLLQ